MILHALTIINNELNKHLKDVYNSDPPPVALGNMAEILAKPPNTDERKKFYISIVNIKEEKTLKNLPNYRIHTSTNKVTYENQPVFLNFFILMAATHSEYNTALMLLSRVIRFFQSRNVFTQSDVAPESITLNEPANARDRLETFKLIFDLYSPSMEEINHLWGTLGGKQYPFVLYNLRMLDLKYESVYAEGELLGEVVTDFRHNTDEAGV